MFFRILKKDLKRKRTMNIIILLFVILATMFVASSINNIVTVTNGLDHYFEMAGLDGNYFVISMANAGGAPLNNFLDDETSVNHYRTEPQIVASSANFTIDGKKTFNFDNVGFILSIENAELNYFDRNNNFITDVEEGEVYITGSVMKDANAKPGDTITLEHNGTIINLKIAGVGKDAFLGSDFMSNPRFIIHPKDYAKLMENETIQQYYSAEIYYISTDDVTALMGGLADKDGILFDGDIAMIRMCYVMSMIVAGVLLVISLGLILVSFTVLRFTIGFTISEEFREIGVMKAMGITNFAIRRLYLIKYLGIAVIGAVIGYIASVPFGSLLLESVSQDMVLENGNNLILGLLCSAAVVILILLFCYSCTKKVSRLSPIDAVRNGQIGERFRRKSLLHLGKNRLGTTCFLAANDIFSAPKQFGIIAAVFSICLLMVMILANTANTLCSDKLIPLLHITCSDAYYVDNSRILQIMNGEGDENVYEMLHEVELKLSDNGIPAECLIDVQYKYPISFEGNSLKLTFQQGKGTHADEYVYNEGTAPQSENEIALTPQAADLLGAHIGDTVQLDIDGDKKDYIVTAYFSSFNQLGELGRLHEDVKTDMSQSVGALAIQINFTDSPDQTQIEHRLAQMKDIFQSDKIYTAAEYVNDSTKASDTVRAVEYLLLMITLMITALVTVLMERSFIAKEHSEIALMKAIGIQSRKIIAQHTLRFVFVVFLSVIIAAVLCLPFTKLFIDPIFHLMGTSYSIAYEIKPLELFVLYPLFILIITVLSALLTSLYTKTITASQTANIE